jgi:negative regulator of flagellin synthesis FlgM
MINGLGTGGPLWGLPKPEASNQPAPAVSDKSRDVAAPARAARSPIVRQLAASPPVDTARVEQLRAEIAGGRYRIDPDAIAAAMLRLEPRRQ